MVSSIKTREQTKEVRDIESRKLDLSLERGEKTLQNEDKWESVS